MADEILLIPIPELPPAPASWTLDWPLAIGNPTTKRSHRATATEFAERLVEQGAFADIRNTKFYVAGRENPGDPAVGDSQITDASLQGYSLQQVDLRGIGPLIPGQDYLFNGIDTVTFNSLDPENPGPYSFNSGDVIAVSFEPRISSIVAAPGSIGKGYTAEKRHTSSGNILPDDFFKMHVIVATGAPVNLVLPPGSNYPQGVRLTIVTNMVNTCQSTIRTAPGDIVFLTPTGVDEFILGFDEQATLVWFDDGNGTKGWQVDYISPSYKDVGLWFLSYLPVPNSIPFDGRTISKLQYPRAKKLVAKLQELYLDAVVDFATWESDPFEHRTKWATEEDSDNIIVPDWQGLFARVLPGARSGIDQDRGDNKSVPGSFEGFAMKKHNHTSDTRFNKLGARASDVDGTGTPTAIDNVNPDSEYRVGIMQWPGGTLWNAATIKDVGESEFETRSINGGLPAYGCI
ncbi:hypothetical protein HF324_18410 [Chitinophaga oryzae]|uniref:Uncharacterized protein n=1 Tax=Chitinophaga oryzae TaxID=2725414 RepID=A0ABX6LI91_9BACT|nr:hypothetical protein [Chitinophaga oryzae]QJB39722.1 hypothetical protein HF324_18410 [Chitinophaga oryzae]